MCFTIPVLSSHRPRRPQGHHRKRNTSNLIYAPRSSPTLTRVVGGLWNCQSAVQKADFISALASHHSLHFLALTETWITHENSSTPAALSSAFNFSHSPRQTGRGGGTGLLLSRKWNFTPLSFPHLSVSSFEYHAVTVSSPTILHIIVIYRPPCPLGNFIDELDTLLSLFPVDGSPLLLLGDFNLPSDKLQSSCLQPLLSSFDLTLNPSPPTHRGGNTLDLVFSRPTPALDAQIITFYPSLSPVQLFLSISPLHIPPSLGVTCAPSTRSSPPAPWLSDVLRNNRRELRRAERKWRRSQLDSDLHTYQAVLSRFSAEVTTAKSSFYKRKLEESASDPRKLFSIFSSLLNPPSPPPPSSLTPEDFVTFFEEKVNKICQSFSPIPVPAPPSISPHPLATNSLTCFSSLSSDDILQLLESSNPTTCPLDPIPSPLLRSISLDLLPFISSLINSSLSSGCVPQAFKTARVVPILKKPLLDSSDVSSYRPNQLQDINQSGFKPAHSTETALIAVTERLQTARSAKLSSVLILLDLSAAFDTVNHKILLSVLTDLGITGTAWKWFESYLEDRHYQHACLTDISSWMTAHHLKLNPSKTELLFIPSTTGPHCDLTISFGNSLITPTEDARSLGVILDGQLSFSAHIANLTRSHPAAGPVSGHFKTRLLQLAPGWSSSAGHQALATCPERCSPSIFNLPKFTHVTPLLRSPPLAPCRTSTGPLFGQCLSS
ncbi:hypothetical protein NFI96_021162, partial [Prochilodus magdalenae]